MRPAVYRFVFDRKTPLLDAEMSLHLAMIEQALCIHAAIAREPKGSQFSLELLRGLSVSMRGTDPRQVAA